MFPLSERFSEVYRKQSMFGLYTHAPEYFCNLNHFHPGQNLQPQRALYEVMDAKPLLKALFHN